MPLIHRNLPQFALVTHEERPRGGGLARRETRTLVHRSRRAQPRVDVETLILGRRARRAAQGPTPNAGSSTPVDASSRRTLSQPVEDPREGTPSRASGARASEMSAPAPARATIALANIAVREDDADDVDARALARARSPSSTTTVTSPATSSRSAARSLVSDIASRRMGTASRLSGLENRTADATRRDQTGRARSMRCNVMELNAIALD